MLHHVNLLYIWYSIFGYINVTDSVLVEIARVFLFYFLKYLGLFPQSRRPYHGCLMYAIGDQRLMQFDASKAGLHVFEPELKIFKSQPVKGRFNGIAPHALQ